MSLESYLTVSAVLFALGLIMFISRRNSVAILMAVELIISAAAINFVAFSTKYINFSPAPFTAILPRGVQLN